MANTLDKWMETAGNVASGAVKATEDLVHKGYDKANELALSAKIAKMHRQLGALIYALRKNGEDNEPMIQWYVEEIDRLKAQMPAGRKWEDNMPDSPDSDIHRYGADAPEDGEDAMFRSGNRDEFP